MFRVDLRSDIYTYNRNLMICIVSGPSCVGKSTFLQDTQVYPITNLLSTDPVVFPYTISNQTENQKDSCFIHYNTLRVADQIFRNSDEKTGLQNNFTTDLSWGKISKFSTPTNVIVLVASRTVLENRMLSRQFIETKALTGFPPERYSAKHWIGVLNSLDLHAHYLSWCSELRRVGKQYTLINSESEDYQILKHDELRHLNLNK